MTEGWCFAKTCIREIRVATVPYCMTVAVNILGGRARARGANHTRASG
jgi:hypothetical protein